MQSIFKIYNICQINFNFFSLYYSIRKLFFPFRQTIFSSFKYSIHSQEINQNNIVYQINQDQMFQFLSQYIKFLFLYQKINFKSIKSESMNRLDFKCKNELDEDFHLLFDQKFCILRGPQKSTKLNLDLSTLIRFIQDAKKKVVGVQIQGQKFFVQERHINKLRSFLKGKVIFHNSPTVFYEYVSALGYGSFSQVLEQSYILSKVSLIKEMEYGDLYAMKQIIKKKESLNEIEILRYLDHENVILFHECFLHNGSLFIITEYAKNHLDLESLDHDDIKCILQQILSGLVYIHSRQIVHRDIKLENIIIDSSKQVKIIDFGFAVRSKQYSKSICGSPGYIAPELFDSEEIITKSDIFSLGVIMVKLYTKKRLFKGNDIQELMESNRDFILNEQIQIPDIPDDGNDLLMKLIDPDPDTRLSAEEALEHHYFSCTQEPTIFDVKQYQLIPNFELTIKKSKSIRPQNTTLSESQFRPLN
ncbi:hypothetical protein pb186bvf_016503 [Paramecium bursaria]